MNRKNSSTAFLIFIRTADKEATAKSFFSGLQKSGNRFIAQKLNKQIIAAVKQTKFPYFIISSDQQVGENFGARITNAMNRVFAKGYEKLVVVGNDCPALNASSLIAIADQLRVNALVVGPNLRGGVYAIGIDKKYYQASVFQNFEWETDHLLASFQSYARQCQIALFNLTMAMDINNAADFCCLAKSLNAVAILIKELRQYLASLITWNISKKNILQKFHFSFEIILRGPPIIHFAWS